MGVFNKPSRFTSSPMTCTTFIIQKLQNEILPRWFCRRLQAFEASPRPPYSCRCEEYRLNKKGVIQIHRNDTITTIFWEKYHQIRHQKDWWARTSLLACSASLPLQFALFYWWKIKKEISQKRKWRISLTSHIQYWFFLSQRNIRGYSHFLAEQRRFFMNRFFNTFFIILLISY